MGRGIPLRVPSTWVCTRSRAPARGQYHLDKENHREVYSKKQSTGRKKQSGTSSNPAYTDVFFEPFLLRFFLSKWYCPQGAPLHPAPPLPLREARSVSLRLMHTRADKSAVGAINRPLQPFGGFICEWA